MNRRDLVIELRRGPVRRRDGRVHDDVDGRRTDDDAVLRQRVERVPKHDRHDRNARRHREVERAFLEAAWTRARARLGALTFAGRNRSELRLTQRLHRRSSRRPRARDRRDERRARRPDDCAALLSSRTRPGRHAQRDAASRPLQKARSTRDGGGRSDRADRVRNALDALPKHGVVVRPTTVDVVVHPPIPTTHWTTAQLDDEIAAIHRLYEETLDA